MPAQTVSNFAAVLKTLYPDMVIADLTHPANTLLAVLSQRTDFYGENEKIPINIGEIAGLNQAFSYAQSGKAGSIKKAFFLTRKTEYAIASIENELIEASAADPGAFVEGIKSEMDSAFRSCGRRIGFHMYRDGSGALGTIKSTANLSSTTLLLTNADDIVNFNVNQRIVFADSISVALRTTTPLTITAIDEDAGSMTLSATPASVSGNIAVLDVIFTYGDYINAGDRNCVMGLLGYMPDTAPTSGDSFFGLDRSIHATRLAGHRMVGTNLQIDEALYKLATRIARSAGKPDCAFISTGQYEVLQNVLGTKIIYDTTVVGNVAFEAIKINGPAGGIKVYADFNCPPDRGFVLSKDTWKLHGLNGIPHILGLETDGLRLMREATADASELRVGFYGNLACKAPGHNGRITLTVPD